MLLKVGSCQTMAINAKRAGAQQVFDIEDLIVETLTDTLDSLENRFSVDPEGFQHFHSQRPMVALR